MAVDADLHHAAAEGRTEVPEPTGPEATDRHKRLRAGIDPVVPPEPGAPPPEALTRLACRPPEAETAVDGLLARAVSVPTTWEREGFPKTLEGPVWFAVKVVVADGDPSCGGLTLRFGAVSYFATIWVDGARVATHRGMWDPFDVDVTDVIGPNSVIAIEVYKPWSRFPVRESLAGFIPYVTTTFGGPWQPVELVAVGDLSITDAWVRTEPATPDACAIAAVSVRSGKPRRGVALTVARVSGPSSDPAAVRRGAEAHRIVDLPAGESSWELDLDALDLPWWSPRAPQLAELVITVEHDKLRESRETRAAKRTVSADGTRLLLNGRPVYPRGVLHWMAYPDRFSPDPTRERAEAELGAIQALGYTMVKLCLVLPPEVYFEVADELGVFLWVEFPMWLPRVTEGYAEQAETEYQAMVRRIRNHPSVLLYTLGCELSSEANADILKRLYELVKHETAGALVRDNSGSAEAYGGVAAEFADFSDYHFYAEATVFSDLMDHFLPAWKPARPLLFGEYCDSDTFRSVAMIEEHLDHDPFWADDDPVRNPQGVRWDYHVVSNRRRLADPPVDIPYAEITRRSYERSLEYRKSILEQTRLHHAPSGYVVTNLQDTPVTTSGMLDDFGGLKFDPAVFRRFNADTVLLIARDRRRSWRAGGDRRQFLDEHCVAAGETVRLNVICSHFGVEPIVRPVIEYQLLEAASDNLLAQGAIDAAEALSPGSSVRLAQVSFTADAHGVQDGAGSSKEVDLRIAVKDASRPGAGPIAENFFPFWVLDESVDAANVAVYDPIGAVGEAITSAPGTWHDRFASIATVQRPGDTSPDAVLVSTVATEAVVEYARAGGPLVLLLQDAGEPLATPAPFYREGIALIHDNAQARGLLGGLPHRGFAGTAFSAVAPDRALDPSAVAERFGADPGPVVSRLDARRFQIMHYLSTLAVGAGVTKASPENVVVTTLRLTGGDGRTPLGFGANVLGRYVFASAVRFLSETKRSRSAT